MSSASAPQSKLPLTVGHMTVKVAAFFVLPESLLRFDAQHDQLELVLKPYAKYYYDDQRVTIIELPEHVLTFSSEAIVQRFGVLDLDLDAVAASAAATTATAAASSAATTQQTGTRSRHDTCSGSYGNAGGGGGGSSRDVRRDDTDDNSGSAIITTTTAARSSSIGGGGGGGGATSVSTNRATSYQHPPASCNVNNSQYAYPCASNSNSNSNNSNSNNSNNNSGGHAIVADATYNLDNSDGSRNTANDVNDNDASAVDKAASDAAGVDAPTSALATATAATTAQQPHTFDVYFPSRADLKVILQVFTALRHRRVSCSSTRWLSPPPRMGRTHNNMAAFAVAEGEVLRHKTVNRLVGMTVGRLLCCVQLPGVTDDLRRVPLSAARIAVAVERLYRDSVRLCARAQAHAQRDTTAAAAATKQAEQQQQASNNNNKGNNNNNNNSTARGRNSSGSATTTAAAAAAATTTTMTPMSVTALQARLARGESELSVYTSLLLHYDPQHYERRVQRLFDMYPMCDQEAMAAWAHVTVAGLLSKYATRLHELMWKLCMKIGPEYGSVSPRVRYMVYRWYHKLTDDDANAVIAAAHPHEYNLLDYEPDLYMQTLVAHFGPELLPTRYNFSPIETSAQGDAPALFLHTLRCPPAAPTSTTSSERGGNNTSSGSTVRPRAVPLQMTPNERPLRMPERAGSGGGGGGAPAKVHEIDLLLEKYRGDFNYMIAPLAEAVEAVVRSHEAAIHAGTSAAVAVLDAIDAANTAAAAAAAAATSSSSSSSSSQHAGSSRGAEATTAAAAAGGGSSAAATTTTTATTTAVVAAAEAVMDTVKTTSAVCDLMRVFLSRNPCGSYTAILHRMANYTFISPSSMLTGVIYLDRLCMCVPTVPLTRYFVEKLLVTAVRVASKIVDLRTVNNKNFANAFSLSTASLNAMEEALLMLMGFNCFVSPEEFYTYARRIVPPTSPMLPPPLPLAVQQQQHAQARAALVAADSAAVPPPLAHGNNTNNASSGSSAAGGGNARTGVYATMSAQAQQQQQPPPSSTVSSATTATTSALYAKRGLERSRTATDGVVASAATTTVASAAAAVAPMMSAPASAARERDAVVQTRLATAGSAVTSAHSSSHGGSHGDTAASPTAWQPVPPTGTRPAHAVHAPRASLVAGATNVAVTMSTMTSSNNNSSNNAAAATSAMSLQQQQQTGVAAAVGGGVAGTRSTIHGAMATTTTTNATSACSPARSGSACVGADATAVADADVSGSSVSHHSNSSSSHNYNTSNTSNHPRASHYGGEGGAGGMTYTTAAAAAATMAASVDGNGTTRMLNAAMSPARLGGAATAITGVVVTSNNGAGNGDGGGGGSSMSSIASGSNNNNTTTTAAATTAVAVATAAAAAAAAVAGSSGGGAVVYVDKMPVSTSVRSRASPHSALAHVC